MNLYGKSIHKQLQYITYIPQKAQLDLDFPINVEKVILSGCYQTIGWFKRVDHASKMKFHKLLRDLDLESLQYKQISELSGGQLQRVLVARALMTDSTIYLLDEPFVGIDFNSEQLIMEKLQHLKIRANLFSLCIMICRKLNNILIEFFLLNRTVRFFGPSHQAMQPQNLNRTFLFNVTSTLKEGSDISND